jgi:hypothetical protein
MRLSKALLGSRMIRALKIDGGWIEGVFDLGDVKTVRDKISTACKWPR